MGDTDGHAKLRKVTVGCRQGAYVSGHHPSREGTISAIVDAGCVRVEVVDDGVGAAATNGGTGLRGLADRVDALDGRLTIVSPAGAGTTVRAELPCAS